MTTNCSEDDESGKMEVSRRDREWAAAYRLLEGIAQAYFDVYEQQRLSEFWGLREFYAAVRSIGLRWCSFIFFVLCAPREGFKHERVHIHEHTQLPSSHLRDS